MPEAWEPDASFDLDRVRARIARHFPELVDDSLRVAGEGWDFVLIGARDDRVVRVPKRRAELERLQREVRVLEVIADDLPLAVPRYEQFRAGMGVYRWLPGEPALDRPPLPDAHDAIASELAGLLTRLHATPLEALAMADLQDEREESAPRSMRAWARRDLEQLGDTLPASLRPACQAFFESDPPPAYAGVPVLTHSDLGPEHILVDGSVRRVTGIIDWGDVALSDPALDFAGVFFWGGESLLQATLAGYGARVDPGLAGRARYHAYCAAVGTLRYGLSANRPAHVRIALRALGRIEHLGAE